MDTTTDFVIWEPYSWWEHWLSRHLDSDFFPDAEIIAERELPPKIAANLHRDPRTKIAILDYNYIPGIAHGDHRISDDQRLDLQGLQWADLVIVFNTEQLSDWWYRVYARCCEPMHTDRVVCLFNGLQSYNHAPVDLVHTDMLTWFTKVAVANHYRDITATNTPFRRYMFDCLIGSAKPGRMRLFYRLWENTELRDLCLINLHSNPHGLMDAVALDRACGAEIARHGLIENFQSPRLLELESDVMKQFKTQARSAAELYSVNPVPVPGPVPGGRINMSCLVPWNIYEASWYSIVAETSDSGSSSLFISEKIAKCLYAKRIFVVFGSAGLLAYLRRWGFETWSDIIDESYDQEPNDARRYEMAWQQVLALWHTDPRAVYDQMQDRLERNHQRFMCLPQQQISQISMFINAALKRHRSFAPEQVKIPDGG
jgi:hypothetical protein